MAGVLDLVLQGQKTSVKTEGLLQLKQMMVHKLSAVVTLVSTWYGRCNKSEAD